jgi:hypothetical protein
MFTSRPMSSCAAIRRAMAGSGTRDGDVVMSSAHDWNGSVFTLPHDLL